MTTDDLDLLVIGGGPAGMSAALWARMLKLRFVALDAAPRLGGQLERVYNPVADYPGSPARDGAELAKRLAAQLAENGVAFETGVAVSSLDAATLTAETSRGPVRARNVLVATGVRRRTLGVPGEAELVGRGVSPSATKYAAQFAGKRVLVVGGGDAALEETLILARACESVIVAHRGNAFRARPDFRARVAADPKIRVLFAARLLEIVGDAAVTGARLDVAGTDVDVGVEGVFVCVGVVPNSELVVGSVASDDGGFVVTDARQRTSVPGIYAAGDVCAHSSWTIVGGAGQGAAAAKDVARVVAGWNG